MNRQTITTFALILIVVLAAVWAVNHYFVREHTIPVVKPVAELGQERFRPPPVDNNIIAATLESIRAVESQKGAPEEEPPHLERNPFLWPGEVPEPPKEPAPMAVTKAVEPAGEAAAPAEKEEEPAVLKMVLVGQNKRIALIDDDLVYEGSEFKGRRVARIYKNTVILSGGAGETKLTLGEMTLEHMGKKKEPKPKPPAAAAAGIAPILSPAMVPGAGAGSPGLSEAEQQAVQQLMQRLMQQPAP